MTLAHRITSASEEKYRALLRQRRIATALLLIAMAAFLATQYLPPSFVVRLFAAAAEAALVGGFADWFAVTALFRHPLGLPIPHTALIRTQKDRIGRALGNFSPPGTGRFLTRSVTTRVNIGFSDVLAGYNLKLQSHKVTAPSENGRKPHRNPPVHSL